MSENLEPWLRGTLTDYDALRRQVLHALELAGEDVERWCAPLDAAQMEERPAGLAPVAFHLRHMARSLDRLLTYAEGNQLSPEQLLALRSELVDSTGDPLKEFRAGLARAMERVKQFAPAVYEEAHSVGRQGLHATAGGLLIHCAEHTQRHVGQAITTARVVTTRTAFQSRATTAPAKPSI